VEIGTNQPGEIAYGAKLAEPDIAILTRIACAHTEGLGTVQAVAEEKGNLLEATRPDGAVVFNADDDLVRGQLNRAHAKRLLSYGRAVDATVRLSTQRLEGYEWQEVGYEIATPGGTENLVLRTSLQGDAGAYAIGAALAVNLALSDSKQLHGDRISRALDQLRGESGRLQPRKLPSGLLLIDDSYNANPPSMEGSLRYAHKVAHTMGRRLVLVLGEMRELGVQSRDQHERIGRLVREVSAAWLIGVGGHAQYMVDTAMSLGLDSSFAPHWQSAVPEVLDKLHDDDVVLVKGSRSIGLERVVEAIEARGVRASA
jgi:UDP-N-acetylmuramoyl-tripeptide--D-alanyl-D-alanine ligase